MTSGAQSDSPVFMISYLLWLRTAGFSQLLTELWCFTFFLSLSCSLLEESALWHLTTIKHAAHNITSGYHTFKRTRICQQKAIKNNNKKCSTSRSHHNYNNFVSLSCSTYKLAHNGLYFPDRKNPIHRDYCCNRKAVSEKVMTKNYFALRNYRKWGREIMQS